MNTSSIKAFAIKEGVKIPPTGCFGRLKRWLVWGNAVPLRLQFDQKDLSIQWVACTRENPGFWKRRFFQCSQIEIDGEIQDIWINKNSWEERLQGAVIEWKPGQTIKVSKGVLADLKREPLLGQLRMQYGSKNEDPDLLIKAFVADIVSHLPEDRVNDLLPKILTAISSNASSQLTEETFLFSRDRIQNHLKEHSLIQEGARVWSPSPTRSVQIHFTPNGTIQVKWIYHISSVNFTDQNEERFVTKEDGSPFAYQCSYTVTTTMTIGKKGCERTFQEGIASDHVPLISGDHTVTHALRHTGADLKKKDAFTQVGDYSVASMFYRDVTREPLCIPLKTLCPEAFVDGSDGSTSDAKAALPRATQAFIDTITPHLSKETEKSMIRKITAFSNQDCYSTLFYFAKRKLLSKLEVQTFLAQYPGFVVEELPEGKRSLSIEMQKNGDVHIHLIFNIEQIVFMNHETYDRETLPFPSHVAATVVLKATDNEEEETLTMALHEGLQEPFSSLIRTA